MSANSLPRLCIVTQWYPPEQAPFGRMMSELAEFSSRREWDVTVITGFPNHPSGQVFKGFTKRWLQRERVGGVTVLRVWLFTAASNGLLTRLLRFATFTLTSIWRLLREPRFEVVFGVLQPLSMGIVLPFVARLKRARLVLNIQDLHPDTQIRLGLVRNPLVIHVLRAIEAYAYRHCAALTVICEPFREHVVARGAPPDRVVLAENWIDTERIRPLPPAGEFRAAAGLSAQDFVVLWAGTLGYISGAALIIEAAICMRQDSRIKFLVVGEGPLRGELIERARRLSLTNVIFQPFQPEEKLAQVQAAGDVSLLVLAPTFADTSVPSKVLAYMAAGRPIVAAVAASSPTAQLVQRAGAGVIVRPDDPEALAQALRALCEDRAGAQAMGASARSYAVENLSRDVGVARLERALRFSRT